MLFQYNVTPLAKLYFVSFILIFPVHFTCLDFLIYPLILLFVCLWRNHQIKKTITSTKLCRFTLLLHSSLFFLHILFTPITSSPLSPPFRNTVESRSYVWWYDKEGSLGSPHKVQLFQLQGLMDQFSEFIFAEIRDHVLCKKDRHCPQFLPHVRTPLVGCFFCLSYMIVLSSCVYLCVKWHISRYSPVKLFYFVPLWQKHTEPLNNTYQLPPPFSFFQKTETTSNKTGMKGSHWEDMLLCRLRKLLTLQIDRWTKKDLLWSS